MKAQFIDPEMGLRIFRAGPVAMSITHIDTGYYFDANDSYYELLGYQPHEVIQNTAIAIGLWADIKDREAVVAQVKQCGVVKNLETRFRKKSGEIIDVLFSVERIDVHGEDCILALFYDITERKRAEQQHQLIGEAFESISEAIILADIEGKIASVNKAFTAISGYPRDEILGSNTEILRLENVVTETGLTIWDTAKKIGSWQGETKSQRKNGEIFPVWLSINSVRDRNNNVSHYVAIFNDISKHKQNEARLEFLTHHDMLTALPNRTSFNKQLDAALIRTSRQRGKIGLLQVDLDRFQTINDSLGHQIGDRLLEAVAERLRSAVRGGDILARLGGDEFTLLLDDLHSAKDAGVLAQKLLNLFTEPFAIGEQDIFVSASIGVACYPEDGEDAQTLLKNAEIAMYRAKDQGRNMCQFFSPEMNNQAIENLAIANNLRTALDHNEFLLHYQPRVDLVTGKITGAEALIRWCRPGQGMVPPIKFIPLAEDTGAIIPIGKWVLKTACQQVKEWHSAGIPLSRIAVNLSARQFLDSNLTDSIVSILNEVGLDPCFLELEITESMAMKNPERTAEILTKLKEMGIAVAIDDFGTGHSSLNYLKRFPIDYLKIDKSFVDGIPQDEDDIAIAKVIIALAKNLRLGIIAEGIETQQQYEFLQSEGCREAQGYLFSKPLPPTELTKLLKENLAHETTSDLRNLQQSISQITLKSA